MKNHFKEIRSFAYLGKVIIVGRGVVIITWDVSHSEHIKCYHEDRNI